MKKSRIILIVSAVVVMIAIACGYIKINHQYPATKVVKVKMGDESKYQKDVTIRVDKKEILPDKVSDKIYKKIGYTFPFDMKIMEVTVTLKNESQENKKVQLSRLNLESTGASNGIDLTLAGSSFEERYVYRSPELKPGESRQLIIPYEIVSNQFNKSQWKKINKREFWITYSAYPKRHILEFK